MKWLDLPPVWLVAMLGLAWLQQTFLPVGPEAPAVLRGIGAAVFGGGLTLTGLAAIRFVRARTTLVPHRRASALVTTGIYAISRNPIYLADAMMLSGALLYWGAWPSFGLVPVFVWIITIRFIRPEEARLRDDFPESFERYASQVHRWI